MPQGILFGLPLLDAFCEIILYIKTVLTVLWRVIDNLFIYFDRVCKREALHCRICSTFCNDICLGV